MSTTRPHVGVLALQGDVREHVAVLRGLDVEVSVVRRPEELAEKQEYKIKSKK